MSLRKVLGKVAGEPTVTSDCSDVDDGAAGEFPPPSADGGLVDVPAVEREVEVGVASFGELYYSDVATGERALPSFDAFPEGSPSGCHFVEYDARVLRYIGAYRERKEAARRARRDSAGEQPGFDWAAVRAGPAATVGGSDQGDGTGVAE
jgi:hypothetical protein